jgi:predicted ester cyclase
MAQVRLVPDWRMTVDCMLAEEDRVMVQWTFYGVHQESYCGLLPTKRPVTYSRINILLPAVEYIPAG